VPPPPPPAPSPPSTSPSLARHGESANAFTPCLLVFYPPVEDPLRIGRWSAPRDTALAPVQPYGVQQSLRIGRGRAPAPAPLIPVPLEILASPVYFPLAAQELGAPIPTSNLAPPVLRLARRRVTHHSIHQQITLKKAMIIMLRKLSVVPSLSSLTNKRSSAT
jgi:hypothetical protein